MTSIRRLRLSHSALPRAAAFIQRPRRAKKAMTDHPKREHTMFMTQIRTALVMSMLIALIGAAAAFFAAEPGAVAQPQPQPRKEKGAGKEEYAKRLTDLLKKRRDVARLEFEFRKKKVLEGAAIADALVCAAGLRFLDAELDLCQSRVERINVCRTHLDDMSKLDAISSAQLEAGKIHGGDAAVAEYYRLDAEIRLEREKAK
jgi:hypothetical protein